MRLNLSGAWATVVALGLISVCGPNASAALVSVDGGLSEWGLTVADNNASNWNSLPNPGSGSNTVGLFTYQYDLEDQNDTAGHGTFLDPNFGGQDYDAEFLGVGTDGTNLVIAIVTGQRPDNGSAYFAPGDIYITTTNGVYGLEVGGGVGGGSGTAITEGASGSRYVLTSSGTTSSHTTSGTYAAGTLVFAPTWVNALPSSGGFPVQILSGGAAVGTADYIYTRNSVTTQHAIIELSIPLSAFTAGGSIGLVQWAPSCGNDVVHILQVGTNILTDVPEPTSLALALMGGLSFVGVRRYRRNG